MLAKRLNDTGIIDYLMLAIERDRRDYLTSGNIERALDQTQAKHNLASRFPGKVAKVP
jgi:hypothetical protein